MQALAEDPEIYEKLASSIAPSIWQMEDVKKGILCQLFGGTCKVDSMPLQ
jgi:DNA replication licensing factor MCM4